MEGLDLDPELLSAGRRVVTELGLGRRVRLHEGDVLQVSGYAGEGYDAVVCQALLIHVPRADAFLADLAGVLPAGTPFAAVETDALARADAIRDSVTDGDPGHATARRGVVAAVIEGARRELQVDRRMGSRLGDALRGAGFADVEIRPVASDQRLQPPYDPGSERARWFAERLRRRREGGGDPVDRFLATAGGLPAGQLSSWITRQRESDGVRLARLGSGDYARDERGGTTVGWGRAGGESSTAFDDDALQ